MRLTRCIEAPLFYRIASFVLACASISDPGYGREVGSSARLCAAAVKVIDSSARKTLAQGSPGMLVLVAKKGEVIFAGTYGQANIEHQVPVRRETVFKLASITKEFTAASILLLMEDGKLKLDDRLSRYVPELPQAGDVTLYQLLVQTSGIPDYADDPAGASTKAVPKTPEEKLAWIASLTPRLEFKPGSKWAYSNSNYALLGLVVERVSRQSLWKFMEMRIFQPAGLTATAFDDPADVVAHRAQGYRRLPKSLSGFANAAWISPTIPGPAGGLRGTGEDLVRWQHALFNGRVLKPASVRLMTDAGLMSDGKTTKSGMPLEWQKGLNSDYGMGVFIKQTMAGARIGHSGDMDGFSTWTAHYPAHAVTIVQMINSESADMDIDAIETAVFSEQGKLCIAGN